jgi:hypothetical protein
MERLHYSAKGIDEIPLELQNSLNMMEIRTLKKQ